MIRVFLRSFAAVLALTCAMAATANAQGRVLIRDAEIERTLGQMSAPIFQAAGYGADAIDIYILQDRSLNAFVANGSNLFLNTGLIQLLETPEELMAVIAHETGHIAGGHQSRRQIMVKGARGPALVALLAGIAAGAVGGPDVGAAVIAGGQGATLRGLLRYNRGEEASADQAALSYLERAEVNPRGLYDVFSRFRDQEVLISSNRDPFLQTHPLSNERLQLIERHLAESANRTYPDRPERTYWHARMRAKLIGYLDRPERVLDRLEGKPETEISLYTKAFALYQLPDLKEAIAATDRLIAMRPNDPFYLELKGDILFKGGNAEAAVPLYRQAVRLAPEEPLLAGRLGQALLALDRPDADAEALNVLKAARSRDMADSFGLRALATAYARAGDEGMASLATAERFAIAGRMEDAQLHARRASAALPNGSPGWLRAQDILSMKID